MTRRRTDLVQGDTGAKQAKKPEKKFTQIKRVAINASLLTFQHTSRSGVYTVSPQMTTRRSADYGRLDVVSVSTNALTVTAPCGSVANFMQPELVAFAKAIIDTYDKPAAKQRAAKKKPAKK